MDISTETRGTAAEPVSGTSFDFTQDWFSEHIPIWEQLLPTLPAHDKFLEIGSFEGRSACWLLQHALSFKGSLYCIDTWGGSPEFWVLPPETVRESFERFRRNIAIAKHPSQHVMMFRNQSWKALGSLIGDNQEGSFDFIYVDGGHAAHQVLQDLCLAWPLLKTGGLMVCDDYIWDLHREILLRPKIAIDAFAAMFYREIILESIGYQYIIRKKEPQ